MAKLRRDIALCEDRACPSRENCIRYLPPGPGLYEWHTIGQFGAERKDQDKCSHFIPDVQP